MINLYVNKNRDLGFMSKVSITVFFILDFLPLHFPLIKGFSLQFPQP